MIYDKTGRFPPSVEVFSTLISWAKHFQVQKIKLWYSCCINIHLHYTVVRVEGKESLSFGSCFKLAIFSYPHWRGRFFSYIFTMYPFNALAYFLLRVNVRFVWRRGGGLNLGKFCSNLIPVILNWGTFCDRSCGWLLSLF